MKKLFFLAVMLCFVAMPGFARDNDIDPNSGLINVVDKGFPVMGLGDSLWSIDVTTPTGDIRCLGVEFDGTYWWVTGAYDMTVAYLHQLDAAGNLVQSFLQPASHFGGWGWRDIAFDGKYLYCGDPTGPTTIQQIDMATGAPTGVTYGPFPVSICRAMAYDPTTDSFWTGSFSDNIVQCFKDGTSNTYTNPGLSVYGAAMDESTSSPTLWIWSQDGSAVTATATEFDPATGGTTGRVFEGDSSIGGSAAGACAYDDNGTWTLAGMHQTTNDTIVGYELSGGVVIPLVADVDVVKASLGGTVNFALNAEVANANRNYGIFAGYSGQAPGWNLPGGVNVPVNWDFVTDALLGAGWGFGQLDANGKATESIVIPRNHLLAADVTLSFAFVLDGPVFDFASNAVDVLIEAAAGGQSYVYDDGTDENLLGWTSGGDIAFIHGFDSGPGDTIEKVSNTYGGVTYPNYGPGNGTPTEIVIWDDPNNDGDPSDAALLGQISSTIQNEDSGTFNDTAFAAPVNVTGYFFVGVMVPHGAGQFVCPLDMDNTNANVWYAGTPGANAFDYNVMANNTVGNYPSGVWLLRAIAQ
jgi:hypothetical protein